MLADHLSAAGVEKLHDAEDYSTDRDMVVRAKEMMLTEVYETITIVNQDFDAWLLFECPKIPTDASVELLTLINNHLA